MWIKKLVKTLFYLTIPDQYLIIRGRDKLYLTFDDGPNPKYTPKVLDILKKFDIKATFFLVGNRIENNPKIVKRIINEGHCIGNHTFSHFSKQHQKDINPTTKEEREEFSKCSTALRKLGVETKLFRPPRLTIYYFSIMLRILFFINPAYTYVTASIDSQDYLKNGVKKILEIVNPETVTDGDIFLFHDDNKYTLAALPIIIKNLKKAGHTFGTVDEILQK